MIAFCGGCKGGDSGEGMMKDGFCDGGVSGFGLGAGWRLEKGEEVRLPIFEVRKQKEGQEKVKGEVFCPP